MRKRLVAGFVPALLVLLFMYTGFNKLFALADFTKSMYNQPIPHWLAYLLARSIPIAEILAAGCLLFPRLQRIGLYASLVLLAIFTGYIGLILLHVFPKIPCSCAGIFRRIGWQPHLWINVSLLALTGLALIPAVRGEQTGRGQDTIREEQTGREQDTIREEQTGREQDTTREEQTGREQDTTREEQTGRGQKENPFFSPLKQST